MGMTAATAARRGNQLLVGPPDTVPVSVVMYPQQTVLALLLQIASEEWDPASGWPATGIGRVLRPSARMAARSFTTRGPSLIPESCTPIPPLADVSVAEQAASLRDMDPAVLAEEVRAATGSHAFAPRWRTAAEQPRSWLNSMADASLDTWGAIEQRWRAAAPLLDREVRRVGTAAVRGCMDALLNSLHPDISYADGVLTFEFPHDRYEVLAGRRLALVPMAVCHDVVFVSFDRPEVCYIGYPLRRPSPHAGDGTQGTLGLVLGPVRAAALRALRQPLTVGELAAALHCAPTTVTYHLHQLDKAGLVSRCRSGTAVRVSRTLRAEMLIDLLAG